MAEVNWQSIAAKFQQRLAELAAEYETKLIFQQEEHEQEMAQLKDGNSEVVPAAKP